jgi:hypothetical protein
MSDLGPTPDAFRTVPVDVDFLAVAAEEEAKKDRTCHHLSVDARTASVPEIEACIARAVVLLDREPPENVYPAFMPRIYIVARPGLGVELPDYADLDLIETDDLTGDPAVIVCAQIANDLRDFLSREPPPLDPNPDPEGVPIRDLLSEDEKPEWDDLMKRIHEGQSGNPDYTL